VTVLVVDDSEQAREITARMLRDEGYNVLAASSGEQALESLARGSEVQVILADIVMPGGMDGFELADRVMAIDPWPRVVLMSGFAPQFPQLDPASRFPLLIKPFSPDQLARQIREVLEGNLH
jgi:two-component system CheB/CheR fusion protein